MKKNKNILIIIFMVIILLFCGVLYNTAYAFDIDFSSNKNIVNKDEEIIVTIKSNEKTVATNLDIEFDSEMLEYVGSITEGLNTATKDNIVACIYVDMDLQGTDVFELKFKVKDDTKKSKISIVNAKFATDIIKDSYKFDEIGGIDKIIEIKGSKVNNFNIIVVSIVIIGFIVGSLIILKIKIKSKS